MKEFKSCKYCGAQMRRQENKCPSCGKQQIKTSTIVALYTSCILVCAVVLIGGMAGNKENSVDSEDYAPQVSQSKTESSQEVGSEEENLEETEKPEAEFPISENYIPPASNQTEVTDEAELVLMQIAEDLAKQIAQNPSTVNFKDWYWGFAREGTTYAVQGTFECSNLMGVTEEHDIQVYCEASSDYAKIQPYAVYLDGDQIA